MDFRETKKGFERTTELEKDFIGVKKGREEPKEIKNELEW